MLVVRVKRKLRREVAIERIPIVLREEEGGGSGDEEVTRDRRGVVSIMGKMLLDRTGRGCLQHVVVDF